MSMIVADDFWGVMVYFFKMVRFLQDSQKDPFDSLPLAQDDSDKCHRSQIATSASSQ